MSARDRSPAGGRRKAGGRPSRFRRLLCFSCARRPEDLAAPTRKDAPMAKRATQKTKKGSSASKSGDRKAKASAAKPAGKAKSTAKKTAGAKSSPKAVVTLSHDEIANRAYMIWLAKGKPADQDAANWRQAERELADDR